MQTFTIKIVGAEHTPAQLEEMIWTMTDLSRNQILVEEV